MKKIFEKATWARRHIKGVVIGAVVVLAGAVLWHIHAQSESAPPPPVVETASVMKADIAHMQSLTGILMPTREVDIAAKTGGELTSLSVDMGSRVGSGMTIAQLDVSTTAATQQSIQGSIAATQATLNATKDLYATRISSVDSSDVDTTDSASTQTVGASSVTDAAVLAKQIDDMLGTLLSVRDGQPTSIRITFDRELGAQNVQAKIDARDALSVYQIADADLQTFVSDSITDKSPSQTTVNSGLTQATAVLSKGQTALKDAYTVLADSISSADVPDSQFDAYKEQVTTLGTQTQQLLQQIHDVNANTATLKKERDTQIASAQAQLAQLQGQAEVNQTMLADGVIHAPFGGVVTQKYVERGAVVAPGTPLVHIADDSVVKLVVGVSDDDVASVHVGDRALVMVDGASQSVSARVTKISPAVDAVSRKVSVELDMDNYDHALKVGSYAHVLFSQPHANALAVPRSAVVSRYGTQFVFVLDGTTVHRRVVTTGAVSDVLVEITSGVTEGDTVVTSGNDYLRDNDTVATTTAQKE